MRDEDRGGRRSFLVPHRSWLIPALLVIGLGLVAGYVFINRVRVPTIDFVVPDGYNGWLVVGWYCDDGQPLAAYRTSEGRDHYVMRYAADGSACISDPFPKDGYVTRDHVYASGGPATVLGGFTKGERLTLTPGAGPVSPRSLFSVDAIREGERRILGDSCDLDAFLQDRFGYPPPAWQRCEPLYAQGWFRAATPTTTERPS